VGNKTDVDDMDASLMKNKGIVNPGVRVVNWHELDIARLSREVESKSWAPFLAAPEQVLRERSRVNPEGQIALVASDGTILAGLSTNRVMLNSDLSTLTTWNDVVGKRHTYEETYNPNGNAIVLISINIPPEHRGQGFAELMIDEALKLPSRLGILDFIGSFFRPLQYGSHKLDSGQDDFTAYCKMEVERKGKMVPRDPWLRILKSKGANFIKPVSDAVTLFLPLEEFRELKATFNPSIWRSINGKWECGECGSWTENETLKIATYTEPNIFGLLWNRIPYYGLRR
jgi:predicted GNAT family acetyltransferase